jgi:hypothetical protein
MTRARRAVLEGAAVAAFVVLGAVSAPAQCAMCRDTAAAASPGTGRALNAAIVGLAAMPYLVGLAAAWLAFPGIRARARRELRRLRRPHGESS